MHDREIITKLKFISKIKVGDKINTRNQLYIQPNNFITKIARTFILQDSRNNALLFVSETVDAALDRIKQLTSINNSDINKKILSNILEDLKLACNGIQNIADTYIDDIIIVSHFETILQNVKFVLETYGSSDDKHFNAHSNPMHIP